MLITLLPPNSPCFRLKVDEAILNADDADDDLKTEVEKALSKEEQIIMDDIESSADRVGVFEALKHLIVGGNVLLHDGTEAMRIFHLDRFVCRRDPMGNPLEIVVHETVALDALPPAFAKRLKRKAKKEGDNEGSEKPLDLYTHVERKANKWTVYQECSGDKIPGTYGTYPLDACPWMPLRMIKVDGEDYGRSYVEEYLGDLKSLEALMQAIIEGSAAAAKLLILVDPNGTTRAKTIETAPNGAVREGNANDISVLQIEKFADFRIAYQTIETLTERLSYAFLLNSSVQRQAERVTAEEVRYMAGELEDALGGIYSMLTVEFQLPYVRRKMLKLEKLGKLPALPKGIVKPTIVTGLEALGRDHDRNKLVSFISTLVQIVGPEVVKTYLNVDDLIQRLATSNGITTKGLIKSTEEIQQAQQQDQMQQMMQQLGPEALRSFTQLQQQGGQPQAPATE